MEATGGVKFRDAPGGRRLAGRPVLQGRLPGQRRRVRGPRGSDPARGGMELHAPETQSRATTPSAGRIVGFDIHRPLPIPGMVAVHFSLVMAADRGGPGWLGVALGLLDGRAAATFVVLAGVGVTLISRRAVLSIDPHAIAGARKVLVLRGVFLLAVGF